MRTRVVLSLVALLAIFSLALWPEAPAAPRQPTSIEQALKTSLVLLAEEGQASCSPIMNSGGYVAWLTCKHVIEAQPLSIRMPNGDTSVVIASVAHPTRDVGILWTRYVAVEPIPLGQSIGTGTEAVHGGYPVHLGLWLSRGLVGTPDEDGDVWSSVPALYGCSGGPVIAGGRIVGVVMGIYAGSSGPFTVPISNISCIVPVDSFRDWVHDQLSRGAGVK